MTILNISSIKGKEKNTYQKEKMGGHESSGEVNERQILQEARKTRLKKERRKKYKEKR